MITNMYQYKNRLFFHNGTDIRSQYGVEASGLADANFCDFTVANGKLFAAAGYQSTNIVRVTDGPSFRETTAETASGFLLRAVCIQEHRGILYAGNLQDEDGTHINRIRWSAFEEPENFSPWGVGNYLNFQDIGDPGEEIVRLISFNNDLVIFKRNSVWIASGVASNEKGDVSPSSIRCINSEFGLVGSAAVAMNTDMIFFLSDGGLWIVSPSYGFKKIDQDIWQEMDKMPRQNWQYACVENDVSNNTLYVGLPNRSKQINEWYIKNYTAKWTRWRFNHNMSSCRCFPDVTGEFHVYFGAYLNGIFEIQKSLRNDAPTANQLSDEIISPVYETGWLDLGKTTSLRSLELVIRQDGSGTDNVFKIDVFHDMSMVKFETVTVINNNQVDSLTNGPHVTGPANSPAIVFNTATQDNFFTLPLRITGHARKVKLRFYTEGYHGRFKILQIKVGTIGRSGI